MYQIDRNRRLLEDYGVDSMSQLQAQFAKYAHQHSLYSIVDILISGFLVREEQRGHFLERNDPNIACISCNLTLKDVYGSEHLDEAHLGRFPGCPVVLNFMANLISRRLVDERIAKQFEGELDAGDIDSRVESFRGYPSRHIHDISRWIESGLYRIRSNRLMCFSCGTRPDITVLSQRSNPDILHIQMSQECAYMIDKCGKPYVQQIIQDTEAGKRPGEPKNVSTASDNTVPLPEPKKIVHSVTCKVCLSCVINVTFFPCRHLVCCSSCSENVSSCPMCRKIIRSRLPTTV